MAGRPLNAQVPGKGAPLRPMGSIPVVVRLVDVDGTERWIAARANRWTASQVLVTWHEPSRPGVEELCWLPVGDVTRAVVGPTTTLAGWWTRLVPPR